ncbi:argininosuccinate lyase [Pontibacter sp. SGAir0037]|uniref:argininosuccinate lyase n=1 Tax=Pontibacter sp. SGAir0037 TaxID=2571030 RepID=UPI0010CCB3B5|nr:argininosuccinate lyase [Pontibacter sp. SGAir0037]QCR21966.1 argininosuccinate lyase [Pontibacter sp. SGAir0037]
MKLWQKGIPVQEEIERFTVGKDRELDLELAPFDILGSLAHTRMLASVGLLEQDDLAAVQAELKQLYLEVAAGKFTIEDGVEDVHSQVEMLLTQRIGDAGKKIHSGRSRNDQVLLDLKLYMRHRLREVVEATETLFHTLQSLSEEHREKLLPGYTHFQVAMPSSFGLWFGAYAESLVDDLLLVQAAYRISNKNPLGSAAGYGSSFPLNRQMTTDLLGFDSLNYNVVYAQMGRGKTERSVSMALASVAATLGRMAMDLCLYMSQNFSFVTLPDELTTGSSIMPHKKNPDVFEIMRGRCNKLQALPNEIALITGNLPSGYHREMQLLKESLLPAFTELLSCLEMANYMLPKLIVKSDIMKNDLYKYAFSVETVNNEVLQGVPFRDAYKNIAAAIAEGTFEAPSEVNHSHEGSIGNLCTAQIKKQMEQVIQKFDFAKVDQAIAQLLA